MNDSENSGGMKAELVDYRAVAKDRVNVDPSYFANFILLIGAYSVDDDWYRGQVESTYYKNVVDKVPHLFSKWTKKTSHITGTIDKHQCEYMGKLVVHLFETITKPFQPTADSIQFEYDVLHDCLSFSFREVVVTDSLGVLQTQPASIDNLRMFLRLAVKEHIIPDLPSIPEITGLVVSDESLPYLQAPKGMLIVRLVGAGNKIKYVKDSLPALWDYVQLEIASGGIHKPRVPFSGATGFMFKILTRDEPNTRGTVRVTLDGFHVFDLNRPPSNGYFKDTKAFCNEENTNSVSMYGFVKKMHKDDGS